MAVDKAFTYQRLKFMNGDVVEGKAWGERRFLGFSNACWPQCVEGVGNYVHTRLTNIAPYPLSRPKPL